jgi:hypothetical protein
MTLQFIHSLSLEIYLPALMTCAVFISFLVLVPLNAFPRYREPGPRSLKLLFATHYDFVGRL